MDSNNDTLKFFPIPRYVDCGELNFYYPYGNTPAEDFLENVSPRSMKEPNILVLGCGDIRSCFYTLWKHFTSESACSPSFTPLFSGVHFVLNDYSAAVLARNVIFLHLCLQKPREAPSEDFKKWLCGVWAIWFSRKLLPAHEQMLSSALRDLLKYASDVTSWASQENPLSSFVHFSSECTLREIRNVWRMWSTRSIDIKAINERRAQHFPFSTSHHTDIENMVGMAMSTTLSSHERERMEDEIRLCSTGNSFAECVVNCSDRRYLLPMASIENLTMYATLNGKFILHSLLPFRCFHHGYRFSPSQLQLNCNDEVFLGKLIVTDEQFEQHPLLANSIQQFALWLSSASTILSRTCASQDKQCTTFMFHCSDAIAFCNELQSPASKLRVEKKFDVIYTSNLLDPVYPPNLVLFAIPLLKPNSYLFTTTIRYKTLADTTQEYLEKVFGVDNKMFPLLFGIRCINHEGSQYKSIVSIRPAPVEANAICPAFTPYYVKALIWEKIPSMIIVNIPPDSILWHTLYISISTILSLPPDSLNFSSSLTVVKMLQTFLSHVSADDSDAQFWEPLCSLLQNNKDIKHLINALQTHSMLSGLHLHLIVTSKTCPVCNKIALQKYYGQFCVSMKPLSNVGFVNIYARIHKPEEKHSYSTFDCLASQCGGHFLRLYFMAPLHLCESGYYVSIVNYEERQPLSTHTTGPLKSFLNSAITYSFPTFKTQNRSPTISLAFGSLCSHYGNGDTFESVIKLSDISYDAYSKSKNIYPERLSPTVIKLSCGVHNFELSYPHPVDFNTLSLKISRSKKTITILAKRTYHRYEDESASVLLVNPDNVLTLPQLHCNSIVKSLMDMQFIANELALLKDPTSCQPLPDLKKYINFMMQEKKTYFAFTDPQKSLYLMVMIVNRVFDYHLKAPAIDLVYSATTAKAIFQQWAKFSSCTEVHEIKYDTIQLMDWSFQYFSRRTICSLQAESLLALQKKVDSNFKRAVIYPLYPDADYNVRYHYKTWSQLKLDLLNKEGVKMVEDYCCSFCGQLSIDLKKCIYCQAMQFCVKCQGKHWTDHIILCEMKLKAKFTSLLGPNSDSLPSKTCSYCHKSSAQLKQCSCCHSVQYCNQDCQKKHWKEHKILCYKQATEKTSSCSYCNTVSNDLKRCMVCLSVQYCNKECQQKHWNEHKPHCSKSEDVCNSTSLQTKSNASECAHNTEQDKIQMCNFCLRTAKDLKKCTRCLRAQYCDRICQQKHWPDHKLMCKSKPF